LVVHLRRDSAVGRRFLDSIRDGDGPKPSARAAGIGKETGYRWLREAFVELREDGVSVSGAQQQLGYSSPLPPAVGRRPTRVRGSRGFGKVGPAIEGGTERGLDRPVEGQVVPRVPTGGDASPFPAIPRGVPKPSMPGPGGIEPGPLLLAALGITVVAYSDNVVTARAFPARRREVVDSDQEVSRPRRSKHRCCPLARVPGEQQR
jgi:hypothetical protein